MMHSDWNLSSNHSASECIRRLAAIVFLMLALIGSPGGTPAAENQSGPFLLASTDQTANDIEIEIKIRRALRQDAQLRPLNLGVQMSGGVANLSGPVPNAELKQRAVVITQRVNGVLAVSDKDLYISTSETSAKRLPVVVREERPTKTLSASPGSHVLKEVTPQRHSDALRDSGSARTGQQITLLAPEMVAPPARIPDAAHLTANPHPVSPAASIPSALEQLRRRDARYQQIRTHVQGMTVYIYSGDTASEDVMTFAQAVRRLPGVQHVILSSNSR